MKKLSVGIVAILAIVFALSSAFTAKKSSNLQEEWFLVKTSVTPFDDEQTQDLTTRSNYENSAYGSDPRSGIDPVCSSVDTEKVCALLFDENNVSGDEIQEFAGIAYKLAD